MASSQTRVSYYDDFYSQYDYHYEYDDLEEQQKYEDNEFNHDYYYDDDSKHD